MNSLFGNIVFDLIVIGIGFGLICFWQYRRFESIKRNHQPKSDNSKSMRGSHLQSIARKYGMQFRYRLDKPLDDHLAEFSLFNSTGPVSEPPSYSAGGIQSHGDAVASSLKFGNVMTGTIGDVKLRAFDHFFLPHCPEVAQSVLVIQSPEFKFPKFVIRQNGNGNYEIDCTDPEHEMIFQQLLTQLPPHSFSLWLEGCDGSLVMCHQKATVAATEFDQFMDIGMDLLEIFAPSMSEPVAT